MEKPGVVQALMQITYIGKEMVDLSKDVTLRSKVMNSLHKVKSHFNYIFKPEGDDAKKKFLDSMQLVKTLFFSIWGMKPSQIELAALLAKVVLPKSMMQGSSSSSSSSSSSDYGDYGSDSGSDSAGGD